MRYILCLDISLFLGSLLLPYTVVYTPRLSLAFAECIVPHICIAFILPWDPLSTHTFLYGSLASPFLDPDSRILMEPVLLLHMVCILASLCTLPSLIHRYLSAFVGLRTPTSPPLRFNIRHGCIWPLCTRVMGLDAVVERTNVVWRISVLRSWCRHADIIACNWPRVRLSYRLLTITLRTWISPDRSGGLAVRMRVAAVSRCNVHGEASNYGVVSLSQVPKA